MTQTTGRTPTNRELLAAKQAQAPITPQASTDVPATRQDTKAAVQAYNQNYRSRYLDEVAPSGIAGRLIKFDKSGSYITTDDEQEVPEGAEFIFLADETLVGWLKFNDPGEAPDKVMGLLFDGFEVPDRETLGDLDKSQWPLGLNNEPQDIWQHQINLVLQDTKTAELFTFSTSSKTGRRAAGNLLRHFERMQRTSPNELPIVRLGRGGFQHKDSRVGFVACPVFVVIGRASRDSAAVPDTSISAYLDDDIREALK